MTFKVQTSGKVVVTMSETFKATYFQRIFQYLLLGGVGIGTNPDEMLVSAASSCYIISLAATLERAKFTDISIEQQSIGTACLNNGKFSMSKIVHHPHIQIPSDQIAQLEKRLPKLITIADNNCMISNAVRNNVDIKIYPIIQAK